MPTQLSCNIADSMQCCGVGGDCRFGRIRGADMKRLPCVYPAHRLGAQDQIPQDGFPNDKTLWAVWVSLGRSDLTEAYSNLVPDPNCWQNCKRQIGLWAKIWIQPRLAPLMQLCAKIWMKKTGQNLPIFDRPTQ